MKSNEHMWTKLDKETWIFARCLPDNVLVIIRKYSGIDYTDKTIQSLDTLKNARHYIQGIVDGITLTRTK